MSSDSEDGSAPSEAESDLELDDMAQDKAEHASTDDKSPNEGKKDAKGKDPNRSKRKKARRACHACQRAHLTCGDERPCGRCVKRGLGETCQDGIRKKAKYLHDAPPEALMPGFAGHYNANNSQAMSNVQGGHTHGSHGLPVSQPSGFYPAHSSPSYPHYNHMTQQGSLGSSLMDNGTMINDFTGQPRMSTPPQYQPSSSQQVSPAQDLTGTIDPPSALRSANNASFDGTFMDPNDTLNYNFNLSDLNFGNHYGALEFGMLGQMSSGAVNTPDLDSMGSMAQTHHGNLSYDGTPGFPSSSFAYNQAFQPWQNVRQSSTGNVWSLNNAGTDAFAVGEYSSLNSDSPQLQSQDLHGGWSSSTASPDVPSAQPDRNNSSGALRRTFSQNQQHRKPPFPNEGNQLKKRRRDPSEIYSSVKAPYPYTQGFHAFQAFVHKRYPSKKVLKIAKALASFRPSFITCNQNLTHEDLIFMEKCFQRTLWEYEEHLTMCGTPTVICRRTGEIAAASKEFCLITGWSRDVLLGREPNLNVNTGGSRSGTGTGASTKGTVTPRIPNIEIDPGRPQPVFLAELLDEDSVVEFYEDYAELAFGASRSSIIGVNCTLLKYKTKNDPGWGAETLAADGKHVKMQSDIKSESLMRGEAGMNALGEPDGRIASCMSWDVRRDVFDIPMMVVMNILPII